MNKIIITADSTADIPAYIAEKYNIRISPLHVIYGEEDFADGITINPEDILTRYNEKKELPSTSAVTPEEYREFFQGIFDEGYTEIVHIAFPTEMSSTQQNAIIAAMDFDGKIQIVDSKTLSVGMMLLAVKACEFRDMGFSAKLIAEMTRELIARNKGSFLISQLDFLHKGGRCSGVTLFGANLLNIKPSIVVNDGTLTVDKKYRGRDEACRLKYMQDCIKNYGDRIDTSCVVLHTTCDFSEKDRKMYKKELKKLIDCDEVILSTAGCVITSHCGPGTFSLFFMLKDGE